MGDVDLKARRIEQAKRDGERADRLANRQKSPTGELDDFGKPLFRKKSTAVRIKGG